MAREIKRVALDFDYPINQMIWKGYHNPYQAMKCKVCDGSGYGPEYKKLSDDWYGFERPKNRWCNAITQDEVQALLDEGRLMDFRRDDPEYVPSADEVNGWSKKEIGHDSINRWICVEARAKRLGIKDKLCKVCDGQGGLWPDEKYEQLADEFKFIDPPAGDGYQLWSTTSEGTPMSPVFAQPEHLARWLHENKASTFGSGTASYEEWLRFIKGPGWAMSTVASDGVVESGVLAVGRMGQSDPGGQG